MTVAQLSAYIPRDRVEQILHGRPIPTTGVALIADISGFTPLTEALTHGLRPDQGAEELTRALGSVFTPLITEIHRQQGSVIKFGGDALIVWFGRAERQPPRMVIRHALTAAVAMQEAIAVHGHITTPIGPVVLRMKIGLAYGSVRRFELGLAEYGYEDAIAGATMDEMAEAEHHAEPGDIMLGRATAAYLQPGDAEIANWREEYGRLVALLRPTRQRPWLPLRWPHERGAEHTAALSAYVPPQIQERLRLGQGHAAELKNVVSLFVQFHGLDYDNDPRIETRLQSYFAQAQRVVGWYGGRLNRLITGDKGSVLHIIFGAPQSVEEQERRAIRCALDLQAECASLSYITMQRIGVAAGRVFAGPVGSPIRHDFTTMGDVVNLSARLMQAADDGQILMDATVRDQLGSAFQVADLGTIMVKGKADPIHVFAAQGVTAAPTAIPSRQPQPIFGREVEQATLHQQLVEVVQGRGGSALLVGDVGLGKTLLLEELRGEPTAAHWLTAVALSYGFAQSGYLFVELMRQLVGADERPSETAVRLAEQCAVWFGDGRVEATYPYLAQFMGLPLDEAQAKRLAGLGGESVRWHIFALLPQILQAASQNRPLVVALDDLQWADETSLELLEAVLPLAEEWPILFLLAMRPQPVALVERLTAKAATTNFLGHLPEKSARALLAHHAPHLPVGLVPQLVEKAGGNPLYLVELVRTLEARGLLAADDDKLTIEALDLPNSVQGLLLAQLDRLATEARLALQMASVIDKTFWDDVLGRMATAEMDMDAQIVALQAGEFIQEVGQTPLGQAHTFRHILIQESAYGTLLYERRRAYHRQVAQVLEELFPFQLTEQAALRGHHYEQAGEVGKALGYYSQAADRARLLYAHGEAQGLYERVLGLLAQHPDEEVEAKTYLKLAQIQANQLDFTAAQRFYERAFALLERVEQTTAVAASSTPPFRWGILADYAQNLDPAYGQVGATAELIGNLFEGLVELDNDLNIVPALATRWEVNEAGTHYRFHLRPEARWADGEPLTAGDFIFAWRRNLHPETQSPLAHLLYPIVGAEAYHQGQTADAAEVGLWAPDAHTLEVTLTHPTVYFPYLLASVMTHPQPRHLVNGAPDSWARPSHVVGNGAWQVAESTADQISLARNPHYRGLAMGNLSEVAIQLLEPSTTAYEQGLVDWCRVDTAVMPPAETKPLVVQDLAVFFLGFACHTPPFDQPLLRRALAHALNKEALVQEVWGGMQQPAHGGLIPPGMSGHTPEIGLRYDPALGRRLLAQAGWQGEIRLGALAGFGDTPAFLQRAWQTALGLPVAVQVGMSAEALLGDLATGALHVVLLGSSVSYPDPDDFLRGFFHSQSPSNLFQWHNPAFDALIGEAAQLGVVQQRLALYHKAEVQVVAQEAVVVPLYYLQAQGWLRPPFRFGVGGVVRPWAFKFKQVQVGSKK